MESLHVSRIVPVMFTDTVVGSGTIVVVIGSITGLFLVLLAAGMWATPAKPRHWLLTGILWLTSSLTIGTLVSGALVAGIDALLEIPTAPPLGAVAIQALAIAIFTAIGGALFLSVPYLPILLVWERVAGRIGWLERTRTGIVISGVLLAIPGTLIAAVLVGAARYNAIGIGSRLSQVSMLWAQIAVCLIAPRLVLPRLAPGAFTIRD